MHLLQQEMDEAESLEAVKWQGWRPSIVYKGNQAIGYTVSPQEADYICERHPEYQWTPSANSPTACSL